MTYSRKKFFPYLSKDKLDQIIFDIKRGSSHDWLAILEENDGGQLLTDG